jgi:cephalosporin hydroxylase
VIVMAGAGFVLVDYVARLLPMLELEGARILWIGDQEVSDPLPARVARLRGDPYAAEVLATTRAQIGAAEHVLVVFQPRPDDALPTGPLSLYGALVSLQSYLVVLGAAFGQPWIGYSRRWIYRALIRFVQDHPGFVVDQTLNQHFLTTSPSGFLRRVLDPVPAERYDAALDDLSGL